MKTITIAIIFIIGVIYFFQNDFDIKKCEYVKMEDEKLLVCPDKRFRAAKGFYLKTEPHAIVFRSIDDETIDHECMHYVLYQFVGKNLANTGVQHDIIHKHQLCNTSIKSLIYSNYVAQSL